MKNVISTFILLLSTVTSKCQIYPLNTFFEDVPDYSYMKDLDNILSQYEGTYKANYNGNEVILYITKEEKNLLTILMAKKIMRIYFTSNTL